MPSQQQRLFAGMPVPAVQKWAALGNITAARRFAQCYGEDVLEKLGLGKIAPSHQGSLLPSRAFNPSEKGIAQDGREDCVPKGGDFTESNATPALGKTAREKTCGNKLTLFHLKVRLLLRRCVYFFMFPHFIQQSRGVLQWA